MCTECGCDATDPELELHHPHTHEHAHGHGTHSHAESPKKRRSVSATQPKAPADPARAANRTVQLAQELLIKNDGLARKNRDFLGERRIAMVNLIGSPGAGKTALLEATIRELGGDLALGVLEG